MQLREGQIGDDSVQSNGVVRIAPGVLIVILGLLVVILLVGWYVLFTPPAIPKFVRLV